MTRELLGLILDGPSAPRRIVLDTELVLRASA